MQDHSQLHTDKQSLLNLKGWSKSRLTCTRLKVLRPLSVALTLDSSRLTCTRLKVLRPLSVVQAIDSHCTQRRVVFEVVASVARVRDPGPTTRCTLIGKRLCVLLGWNCQTSDT